MSREEAYNKLSEAKDFAALEALGYPKIIYCKDCKFKNDEHDCPFHNMGYFCDDYNYCSYAERRDD